MDVNVMIVPLSLNYFKDCFRVSFNKKIHVLNGLTISVVDPINTDRHALVVGHGRKAIGIRHVNNPKEYSRIKGDSPLDYFHQLYTIYSKDNKLCGEFKHTNSLDIMYYDIEVLTIGDNKFPKAETSPIICIGAAFNDEIVKIYSNQNLNLSQSDISTYDKPILEEFLKDIKERDPDIMVGYNSYSFDMPYIIERCKVLGLEWEILFRIYSQQKEPRLQKGAKKLVNDFAKFYKNLRSDFLGRIHYDVFAVDVMRDQSLSDLKNRKMKTLAKHCGFPDVIEIDSDVKNTGKLLRENPKKLFDYQDSDVRQTRAISKRYLPIDIALAEELCTPLEYMINRSNGTPATLYLLREMYKIPCYVIDTNAVRYQQLYQLSPKYEGAINVALKTGKFNELRKYDFNNMYPSSMWTWNLGPDTTKIIGMKDYTGEYKFKKENNCLYMELPDAKYNKQMLIEIDQSKDSSTKTAIEKLWSERAKYKKLMKEAVPDSIEYEDANVRQSTIKIILNSSYGLMGNTHSIGDIATAIVVTAMCRWTTNYVMKLMEGNVVAVDTDGIMTDKFFDAEEINNKIDAYVKENTFVDRCRMKIEDEWGSKKVSGYVYKMKNYVLSVDGITIKHGVSMKASSKAKLCDKAISIAIDHVLYDKMTRQETINAIRNLNTSKDISDYLIIKSIKKEMDEYSKDISTGDGDMAKLIRQVKETRHKDIEKDDQIEYVHVIDPITGNKTVSLIERTHIDSIDHDKYLLLLDDILKIFSLIDDNTETPLKQMINSLNTKQEDDLSYLLNI
jgi:DNA polymerase I